MAIYSEYLPDISITNIGSVIGLFFLAIAIVIGFGIGLYFFVKWLKFNKTITILEDVAGSDDLEPVGKDKAMTVKTGKGGLEVLFLKKRKVYRGAYGKRMGKRAYYFAIGPDGYWYNITLGSLSKGLDKVHINPTSVNMRYQNESLMEIIKDRYEAPNFWEKYGVMITYMAFFMLVAIMFWLYFDSFKELSPSLLESAKVLKETSQELKKVAGALDSLKGSGGIYPTIITPLILWGFKK